MVQGARQGRGLGSRLERPQLQQGWPWASAVAPGRGTETRHPGLGKGRNRSPQGHLLSWHRCLGVGHGGSGTRGAMSVCRAGGLVVKPWGGLGPGGGRVHWAAWDQPAAGERERRRGGGGSAERGATTRGFQ